VPVGATLATLAENYRLDRAGGPCWRFRAYLARVGHQQALAPYNPMADPAALALGWTPLGLPWHAGYRWAIAHTNGPL
jgi:hypothetical protein